MDATQEFLKRRDEQNSEIRFVKGDFHKASTQEEIGSCDVVLCSGVFYHVPDPVATLRALRKICSETLILGTAIIPEMEVKNAAVLYPYLDSKERRLWDRHIGIQVGISGPYEPKAGYENWFWGLTPSAVSSLLKIAGFEVVKQSITTFDGLFICRAVESETIMGDHAPKSSPLSENFMTGRAGDKRGRRLWIDQKDFAQKDNA
jgi:ubiquinone/menaquinone biosynthesis C-methylase UbiE